MLDKYGCVSPSEWLSCVFDLKLPFQAFIKNKELTYSFTMSIRPFVRRLSPLRFQVLILHFKITQQPNVLYLVIRLLEERISAASSSQLWLSTRQLVEREQYEARCQVIVINLQTQVTPELRPNYMRSRAVTNNELCKCRTY